ncbi:Uncharacterized protein HZ326_29372 [Fusarium oxysporum f. sp. albedinis]|nr:Uncharacterized protein HZ326_29372 [Fusarium oxysporum f. sp. albedinis]
MVTTAPISDGADLDLAAVAAASLNIMEKYCGATVCRMRSRLGGSPHYVFWGQSDQSLEFSSPWGWQLPDL